MTIQNKNAIKKLFCLHKFIFIREKQMIETALIKCRKCKKEKRVSYKKARKMKLISEKAFQMIMSNYR